jgi:hypothetical protein
MNPHLDHSLPLPSMLTTGSVSATMKTQRLTISDLREMKTHCDTHEDVELRVIVYCPACRGAAGGTRSAVTMTAAAKTKRAKKAARTRWKKAKAAKKA